MTETNKSTALEISSFRDDIKVSVMQNKEVFNALAQNTFKGLEPANIPKALLEGYMRGFTLKDFMTKQVYAIAFWNKKEGKQDYSLVESISNVRATAMTAGQSGKSEPKYTYEETEGKKKVESCTVTVWKQGGDERGYSATVFFDEYEKPPYKTREGKEIPGMWQEKPRSMIAKVAEMHALRMAFPQELSQTFIEEEFDKQTVIHIDPDVQEVPDEKVTEVVEKIKTFTELKALQDYYTSLGSDFIKQDKVIEAYNAQKEVCKPQKKATK